MKMFVTVKNLVGELLPCRITLRKLSCDTGKDAIELSETIYCDGRCVREIEQHFYHVQVHRGKLYEPFEQVIQAKKKDIHIDVELAELVDTKTLNLYSFDGHSHVSRDETLESGNLERASAIMRGEDFNLFFAGSPYDRETHLEYLNNDFKRMDSYRERFAGNIKHAGASDFILDIGNEIVKCRYGHAFLLNYIQFPPFSKYYDHEFDPWLFTKEGDEPGYKIAYIHEALLKEKDAYSVAVSAHPTSWWWHVNGEFITNIATTLGFEILAGSVDAMVIMGYKSDQKDYQALWYDALNNGYFLPGIAETDAAFDTLPGDKLMYKTYTYAERFDIETLCHAVKAGKNIVSSGPLITLTVNGCLPGSVLPYQENSFFQIAIEAFMCYQAQLSKIQIILNGEIYQEFDICQRQFKFEEDLRISTDSFVIAKCYDFAGNVAITNPVYIRNTPFVNRGYLSKVNIAVQKSNMRPSGHYWADGGQRTPFDEKINTWLNPASRLFVEVDDEIRTISLFELEPLQDIFKNLYLGWFNKDRKYMPGHVPAKFFQLKRIRDILDKVELTLYF